jgi:NADH-quinone oxidoreductase subunit M
MLGETTEKTVQFEDVKGTELIVLTVVSVLILYIGIFPNFLLNLSAGSVEVLSTFLGR